MKIPVLLRVLFSACVVVLILIFFFNNLPYEKNLPRKISHVISFTNTNISQHERANVLHISNNGRLGNNLFQYAALYSISRLTNRTAVLSNTSLVPAAFKNLAIHKRGKNDGVTKFEKHAGHFLPSIFNLSAGMNVDLCCYFQSWRYFTCCENDLRKQFVFKDHILDKAKNIITDIKNTWMRRLARERSDVTLVGVHIRRRDMTLPHHKKRGYTEAPVTYINNAMGRFLSKYYPVIFIISTDDKKWCTDNFKLELSVSSFIQPDDNPYVALATLSLCDHTIITVGSFGWWAGWLAGGDVIYYKNWPISNTEIDNEYNKTDYYLPHWQAME